MLPPDFRWKALSPHMDGGTRWLCVGDEDKCVAHVSQRIDGQWYITVNRHLETARWRGASCASQAKGMYLAERWATSQAARLRAEPDTYLIQR